MYRYKFLIKEIVLFIVVFCVYFNFQGDKVIGNEAYLFNWAPWSVLKPEYGATFNPVLSDNIDFNIPILNYARSVLLDGRIPWWTDKLTFGSPLFSLIFNNFFVFPFLPILVFMPLSVGYATFVFVRVVLSYVFMRLFLRKIGTNGWVGIIFGLLYSYSVITVTTYSDSNFSAYTFLPLLILSAELVIDKVDFKKWLLLIFSVFNVIVSGFPSISFYILFFGALYSVYYWTIIKKREGMSNFLWLIGGVVLSVCLTAFTLLPSYQFFKNINLGYRDETALSRHFVAKKVFYLLNPKFFGSAMSGNFFADGNWNEDNMYQGIIPLFLVVIFLVECVLRDKRDKRGLFFVGFIAFVFVSVFNIGSFLKVLSKFPIFSFNPSTRMIALLPFLFISVAALELNRLTKVGRSKTKFLLIILFCLLGLSVIYFGTIVHNHRSLLPESLILYRDKHLIYSIVMLFLASMGLGVMVKARPKLKMVGIGTMLLVAVADINMSSRGYLPTTIKYQDFYPSTEAIRFLQKNSKLGDKVLPLGRNLIPSMPLYYGIDNIVGHYWAEPQVKRLITSIAKNTYDIHPTQVFFNQQDTNLMSPIIDMLGVKYITTKPNSLMIWYEPYFNQVEFNTTCVVEKNEDLRVELMLPANKKLSLLGVSADTGNLKDTFIKVLDENARILDSAVMQDLEDTRPWKVFNLKKGLVFNKDTLLTLVFNNRSGQINFQGVNFDIAKDVTVVNSKNCQDLTFFASSGVDNNVKKKYEIVYDEPDLMVYRNLDVLPNIFMVSESKYLDDIETLESIDWRNTVWVDTPKNVNIVTSKVVDYSVDNIKWDEETASFSIRSESEGILVVRKKYYPGWEYEVDGQKADIFRVNGIFTGIKVGSGNHIVKLHYKERLFKLGMVITGISIFLVIIGSVVIRNNKHRK